MPPPVYKINKIRKVRQKYSKLRQEVILQTGDGDNSEITDREGIDAMNEADKGLLDDADWEYFGEERDNTKSCNNGEPSTWASDEVESVATTTTAAAAVVVERVEPEYQNLSRNYYVNDGEMDFEGSLDEDEDDNGAENERDNSLEASVELSELLALEQTTQTTMAIQIWIFHTLRTLPKHLQLTYHPLSVHSTLLVGTSLAKDYPLPLTQRLSYLPSKKMATIMTMTTRVTMTIFQLITSLKPMHSSQRPNCVFESSFHTSNTGSATPLV